MSARKGRDTERPEEAKERLAVLMRYRQDRANLRAVIAELAEALGFCIRALEVATTPLPRDREEVRAAQLRARAALEKAGLR